MRGAMKSYTQLTEDQRYQIYELHTSGKKQFEIAEVVGVHKSTVSRELSRNKGLRGYRPRQAQQLFEARKRHRSIPKICDASWLRVEELLDQQWSPEQISGWLALNEGIHISHEWIYHYIYRDKQNGGQLYQHLRCQKIRRKRYGSTERRGTLKNRVSIDERPVVVDVKTRIGDWEADTVSGTQNGPRLVTIIERKSLFTVVGLAKTKHADAVTQVLIDVLEEHKDRVYTITYDNGKEFAGHGKVAQATDSSAYFAHPYSSWERGLNENTNGLLRQYFPKGSDFNKLTNEEIQIAVDKLNNRPRKTLGFKTPNQVFLGINPQVALVS